MAMDAKKSGIRENPITGGKLHLLLPKRQGFTGAYDAYKKTYPRLWSWDMPSDFVRILERAFVTSGDMGLREPDMLVQLEHSFDSDGYRDEAYAYFGVVHPTLTSCPYGLNKEVQMTDPSAGISTPVFQFCPTCQLKDLKSEACEERMRVASAQGMDYAILEALKNRIIEACEASLAFVERKHEEVMSEIQGRRSGESSGRTRLNVVDRIHLKMLHRQEEKDSGTITQELLTTIAAGQKPTGLTAEQVQEMIKASQPEGVFINPDQAKEYEEYLAAKKKAGEKKETNESKTK